MDSEQRIALQKKYEMYSDEGIIGLLSQGRDEFEEEAFMLLEAEARRRNIKFDSEKPQEIRKGDPNLKLIEVYQARNINEADLIRMLLAKENIECTYSEFPFSQIRPVAIFSSDSLTSVRINVREEDIIKAKVLLDAYTSNQSQRKTTSSDGSEIFYCTECFKKVSSTDEVCPHCGEVFEDPDIIYCTECFKPVKTDDDICPHCGSKFEKNEKELPGEEKL